jgi:hypothetical protein
MNSEVENIYDSIHLTSKKILYINAGDINAG